jgi:REP element-mobilizing transposase RayT
MSLVSGSHSSGQNLYHFEWCPKYRYNPFKHEENKKLYEEALGKVSKKDGREVLELS